MEQDAIIAEALPYLWEAFGGEQSYRIESEDGCTSVVVGYPGEVKDAAAAMERFQENWWLDRCAGHDVAFVYEIF